MRQAYLKKVRRALHLPRQLRREVMRDLNELFDAALAGGESEADVMLRLGNPKQFAANAAAELGFDSRERKRRLSFSVTAICLAVFAVLAFAAGSVPYWHRLASYFPSTSIGIIGGADGPTQVYVTSQMPFQTIAFFTLGVILALGAVGCILYLLLQKGKGKSV